MDIISQLQEQVNTIAFITLNTFGTLQRDAPPVRLSPNYPEPPANSSEETVNTAEQAKIMSSTLVQAAKKVYIDSIPCSLSTVRETSAIPLFSVLQFDALVAALPLSGGEEAQLKRIEELQVKCLSFCFTSIVVFGYNINKGTV